MTKPIKLLPVLPAERALKVISGRWKAIILYHLFGGPKRLSELNRLMPGASQKVLIQQLREMVEHGLVHREIFKQVPPRVDYTASKLGRSLQPVLLSLCEWGRRHAVALDEIERLVDCPVEPTPRLISTARIRRSSLVGFSGASSTPKRASRGAPGTTATAVPVSQSGLRFDAATRLR
jgi:DNA-binding HxlR family transcriptional regulator